MSFVLLDGGSRAVGLKPSTVWNPLMIATTSIALSQFPTMQSQGQDLQIHE